MQMRREFFLRPMHRDGFAMDQVGSLVKSPKGTLLSAYERQSIVPTDKNRGLASIRPRIESSFTQPVVFEQPYLLEPMTAYAVFTNANGDPELWTIEHAGELDAWRWVSPAPRLHHDETEDATRH